MSKIAYPSLSSSGYITDPKKRLAKMFQDSILMRHNDSKLYRNTVFNISHLVSKYGQQPTELVSYLQEGMQTYFQRAFDDIDVNIEVTDDSEVTYSLTIDLLATHDNKSFTLSEVLFINPDEQTVKLMNRLGE